MLYGEGNYALTDIKEIDVTKPFMNLNNRLKLCQDTETQADCRSREYKRKGAVECGCTPFSIRDFTKQVRI